MERRPLAVLLLLFGEAQVGIGERDLEIRIRVAR